MTKQYGYWILSCILLTSLSLPENTTSSMRCAAVGVTSGVWRYASQMKKVLGTLPSQRLSNTESAIKELEMVRLENYQLKAKLEFLQSEIKLHELKEEQLAELKNRPVTSDYLKRRKEELFQQLELYSHAITARIIYRESSAWKSSLWINVGEATNRILQTPLVTRNSPVVVGTTVVGIIDHVGETRSRVRLVTDPGVTASIRVIRGSAQKKIALQEVRQSLMNLASHEKEDTASKIYQFAEQFLSSFSHADYTAYLAKGELKGSHSPHMKTRGSVLKGIGFNYDFPDEEGPSRDLRTGKALSHDEKGISLITEGDVIITTGLDSLFPAGLKVGAVRKVYPLQEGKCFYEAEIESFIHDFDELSFVTVLPALSEKENH
ncbi:MAG: rod shape-determining protein MreC [Candidatus Rhabdochlamydia sp.]